MILRAERLRKSYKGKAVVAKVDIEVAQGEIVGLLGPNGAGKTTVFYMLIGLIRQDTGTVFLGDKDLSLLPIHIRARNGLGYLPQEASIFRKLTVADNILAAMESQKYHKSEHGDRLHHLLTEFNISHLAQKMGYMLSGGERRRVEIARVLATEPAFILLDEPFAGIDPLAVADLQEIILILKEKGIGILITDHNVRETLRITDRAYLISEGAIMITGSSAEIVSSKEAKRIYFGDRFNLDN